MSIKPLPSCVKTTGSTKRGKVVRQRCRCGTFFYARQADIDRGWGKACSKRCAAIRRTIDETRARKQATTKIKPLDFSIGSREWDEASMAAEAGWDAHKDA